MGMTRHDESGKKLSVYLPVEMAERLASEGAAHDRSASWLVRRGLALLFQELDRKDAAERSRAAQERAAAVQAGMDKG